MTAGEQQQDSKEAQTIALSEPFCIAAELPYAQVYNDIAVLGLETPRYSRAKQKKVYSHPRLGTYRKTSDVYLTRLGWKWTPTMGIGTGCRVHLRDGELPMGRLIVKTSRHMVAVIDGVIHDTHNPDRNGQRCVYGYWQLVIHSCAKESA